MTTVIISICSDEYKPLGDITYECWGRYASRWGAELIVDGATSPRGPAWQKIEMVRHYMARFDLVLWVGCDTVPTNHGCGIVPFWETHGEPRMLMSYDLFGINSDVMLFRSCLESELFVNAVHTLGHDFYHAHPWSEQEAIIRFAHQTPYQDWVKVIPQKGFNSYLHQEYNRPGHWPGGWEHGDWILHLPGLPLERRIELAQSYGQAEVPLPPV